MSYIQHPTQLIKSQDTIIYVGSVSGAARPQVSSVAGNVVASGAPTMYYLAGVTDATVSISDNEQEYYLLGGGGFADSVIVTTRAQASITSYFQRDLDGTEIQSPLVLTKPSTLFCAAATTKTMKCLSKCLRPLVVASLMTPRCLPLA
jgi:hypothetical protein